MAGVSSGLFVFGPSDVVHQCTVQDVAIHRDAPSQEGMGMASRPGLCSSVATVSVISDER